MARYGDWGWGAWLGMSLMMLVFWGLIAAAVVALVRLFAPGRQQPPERDDAPARRLLDERFARGEIDEEDYTRRRELLARR